MDVGYINSRKQKTEEINMQNMSDGGNDFINVPVQDSMVLSDKKKKRTLKEEVAASKQVLARLFREGDPEEFENPGAYSIASEKKILNIQNKVSQNDRQLGMDFWLLANELEENHRGKNQTDSDEMKEVKKAIIVLRNTAAFIGKENEEIVRSAAKKYLRSAAAYYLKKKSIFSRGEGSKRKEIIKAMLGKLGDEKYKDCHYAVTRSVYNIGKDEEKYTEDLRSGFVEISRPGEIRNAFDSDSEENTRLKSIGKIDIIKETPEDAKNLVLGQKNVKMIDIPRDEKVVPDKLMLNDVKQGVLGDCYFLASLASYIEKYPEEKDDFITDNGDTVTVRFFGKKTFSNAEYKNICKNRVKPENRADITDKQLMESVIANALDEHLNKVKALCDRVNADKKYDSVFKKINEYHAKMDSYNKFNELNILYPDNEEYGDQSSDFLKEANLIREELENDGLYNELNDVLKSHLKSENIYSEIDLLDDKFSYGILNTTISRLLDTDEGKKYAELLKGELNDEKLKDIYSRIMKDSEFMKELLNVSKCGYEANISQELKVYVNVSKKIPMHSYGNELEDATSQGHNWVKLVEKAYALSGLRNNAHVVENKYDDENDIYTDDRLNDAYVEAKALVSKKLESDNEGRAEVSQEDLKNKAKEKLMKSYRYIEGGMGSEAMYHLSGISQERMDLQQVTIGSEAGFKSIRSNMENMLKNLKNLYQDEQAKNILNDENYKDFAVFISLALSQNKNAKSKVKVREGGKEKEIWAGHRGITIEDIRESLEDMVNSMRFSQIMVKEVAPDSNDEKSLLYRSVQKLLGGRLQIADKNALKAAIAKKRAEFEKYIKSIFLSIEKTCDDTDADMGFNLVHRSIVNQKGMKPRYTKKTREVYAAISKKLDKKGEGTVTCGTHRYLPKNIIGKKGKSGEAIGLLPEGHEYSVLKCEEIGGIKFLVLRNPWGEVGIRHEIHSDGKGNITLKSVKDESEEFKGTFRMELNDFMNKMSNINM